MAEPRPNNGADKPLPPFSIPPEQAQGPMFRDCIPAGEEWRYPGQGMGNLSPDHVPEGPPCAANYAVKEAKTPEERKAAKSRAWAQDSRNANNQRK